MSDIKETSWTLCIGDTVKRLASNEKDIFPSSSYLINRPSIIVLLLFCKKILLFNETILVLKGNNNLAEIGVSEENCTTYRE